MNIRIASLEDRHEWDAYIGNYEGSSPYHLFGWGLAVKEAYRHELYYLMAEEDGHIVGLLPLVYMKPPLLKGELVSLPFCDQAGILAEDEAVRAALTAEAFALAKKMSLKHVELREYASHDEDKGSQYRVTCRRDKVQMILALPGSSEGLLAGFKSKLRSQIKKAERNGLTFSWLDISDFEKFYTVFSANMKDLGSPVHSKKWFLALIKALGEAARVGVVYYGDIPVGTGFILCHGKRVSIPWASTRRQYNYLSTNMLLYWNMLKFAADNGYGEFDFGRSTPGEGTYKFKAQWGAEPCRLSWKYIHLEEKERHEGSASKGYREIVEKIWQKMPLSLANTIGPVVRKYISL
ncbi:MAG: FemAB family PEP-CTERM system-associated protein [Deltaproteobacteria bacterium]|nr:FemAB family PEP-CTERM system-associated protein [Deltaproteobacteria bacterium]